MTVAILGGIDRLMPNYEKQAKRLGLEVKMFPRRVPNLPQRLQDVSGIVVFTGTISHPLVIEAVKVARSRGIPIERSHTSSISGLKRCLGEISRRGRLS
ncbi:MAG: DUF2325 domain-containing protein [Nitrospina sp.]|nr:DUF2325 domain-containing protein [Nitrospina sp.]